MPVLPETETIEAAFDGGWLTIWFNQPENRNALSDALVADLTACLLAVREDRSVRGITLRGRGGTFCAGGDLKAFKASFQAASGPGARERVMATSCAGAALFDLVNTMPQVVIALIEGAAMAGGFGLACCADVVIAARDAKFAFTETAIGLSPAQIMPFVLQRLGHATGRRLMLTAARFDGEEAARLRLADFTGETANELEAHEARIRRQVLGCAPGAVADTKRLIFALPGLSRAEAVQAAAENFAGRMLSDEGAEGLAAFVERRKPAWAV
jgi:isohexenylglutaconyl-CoA hydratase